LTAWRAAFRKFKALSARASYSHGGRYTLDEIAEFDHRELWCYYEVCFSVGGTLLETAAAPVENAEKYGM
jgi:hypothetical protein